MTFCRFFFLRDNLGDQFGSRLEEAGVYIYIYLVYKPTNLNHSSTQLASFQGSPKRQGTKFKEMLEIWKGYYQLTDIISLVNHPQDKIHQVTLM